MFRGWRALLFVVVAGCATRAPTPAAPATVRAPTPETTPDLTQSERSPSTGRIEGVYLADDGVLVALNEKELTSIERCHRAGRPLGWALLSVDAQNAIQLVEAEESVTDAASCAREGLSLRDRGGEVLIYLRFL
jgi:hypothetical protein